ncbi:hypothetical protein EDF71_102108 [Comamonas sp. JUb58]|nr:hypothetical protein EDF71_102108 [Comamonas sp. JUb58]
MIYDQVEDSCMNQAQTALSMPLIPFSQCCATPGLRQMENR